MALVYVKCLCVVVSLSQPSDHQWLWYLLYVKCLCVLSRYLNPMIINGLGMCYMLNVCVFSRYLNPVIISDFDICYMINVCVCVVSSSQPSDH